VHFKNIAHLRCSRPCVITFALSKHVEADSGQVLSADGGVLAGRYGDSSDTGATWVCMRPSGGQWVCAGQETGRGARRLAHSTS
jgi:hypothetical protein